MRFRALVAVLGLLAACTVPPDVTENAPKVEAIQPGPYQSQHGLYFKVVDDGSTYMQQLFDHVSVERPEAIDRDVERWRAEDGREVSDVFLVAPTRAAIEHYLASDPVLTVPRDRELAFEQLDAKRWRTYLLFPATELDATSIASAEATHDASRPTVTLDFTPAAARHFGELTTRIAGHKLAVLVDGTVVSAPVIQGAITGGRAQVTFGASATEAQAVALAASLH